MPHLEVQVADDDFPNIPRSDLKLIELAKRYDAKIVTNDFQPEQDRNAPGLEIMNVTSWQMR